MRSKTKARTAPERSEGQHELESNHNLSNSRQIKNGFDWESRTWIVVHVNEVFNNQ